MEIKIITGMSGAGKSTLKDYFENKGFICHDNFPSHLIIPYVTKSEAGKIAFIVDSRTETSINGLEEVIKTLKTLEHNTSFIYLECNDDQLINRFRETKRLHHFQLSENLTLVDAIKKERDLISPIKSMADLLFDTSSLSKEAFVDKVVNVLDGESSGKLLITCMSFGFKHGVPKGIDIFYDVRCFKNPYWVKELKEKTGLDKEVQDYVLSFEESNEFLKKIYDTIDFLIPLYIRNGKKQLNIAFGCTGGHHRSVCFAEKLYEHLSKDNENVIIKHFNIKD